VKNAILVFGNFYRNVFTDGDKAAFIDVQSLPELTKEDWLIFKKNTAPPAKLGVRANRENVSFLNVSLNANGCCNIRFHQEPVNNILGLAAQYPVYWVGSNNRYEFLLGDRLFRFRVEKDRYALQYHYFEFFLDYVASNSPGSEIKSMEIGVVVLPEDHVLRGRLPGLKESLQEGIRASVTSFLSTTFYEIHNGNFYLFNELIKEKNHELFLRMFIEKKGNAYKDFLESWFSAGMPSPVRVRRKSIPFQLLEGGEGDALKIEYYSDCNIRKLDVFCMVTYLIDHGFPLLKFVPWDGTPEEDIKEDLIDYIAAKCQRFNRDGN
jgi:hypothetical protein